MAYRPNEAISDLLFRKEYAQLRQNRNAINTLQSTSHIDREISKEGKLVLQTYQKFPKTFINPNNTNSRLLMKFDTGTGKTVSSIEIALEFISQFMDNYRISETVVRTPEVFIIGFSRQIFIREFMKRPEFGFVTREEILKEAQMRVNAVNGSTFDRDELARFHSEVKKRFAKKSMGGMFRFYGYKELFNRLFIFNLDGLEKLRESLGLDVIDKSSLTEDQILHGLSHGWIEINIDLLDAMTNGLLIFDEFHNVYNSSEINNYGIAIRIILMAHDKPEFMMRWIKIKDKNVVERLRSSLLRAIFLTATPINNSPTEIIDLLNMLVRIEGIQEYYKGLGDKGWAERLRLDKSDFFLDVRNLRSGALEQIARLVRGKVSYLSDTNPAYFPTFEFVGSEIKIPKSMLEFRLHGYTGNVVPYLRFIRTKMSPLHAKTYKAVFSGTLPPDGQMLLDMVLPNPHGPLGIFKTRDIKYTLRAASAKWKAKMGIDIQTQTVGTNPKTDVLVGNIFERKNIGKYAAKYAKLMDRSIWNLKHDMGKAMVSHQLVRMSGILAIEEMFRRNGILDEYSEAVDGTLCSKCGIERRKHKSGHHDFIPARYIILHSDIDRAVQERSIEKFKAADNIDGYNYRFILGSRIINESMDFSEVRNVEIVSAPANYATLLQIIGRAIRKGSHMRLGLDKRHVSISIYTYELGDAGELSYEERKYFEKGMDYLVIQKIEQVFNSEAIDGPLNWDIIFPDGIDTRERIGRLPFEISESFGPVWKRIVENDRPLTLKDLTVDTWNVFFAREEVELLVYAIKRMFLEVASVWTYDELWKRIRDPPFSLGINATLIDEECFVIALGYLIEEDGRETSSGWLDSLFNVDDRVILDAGGRRSKIVWMNPYYMMVPMRITDSRTQLGTNLNGGITEIDIDSWYRVGETRETMKLDITKQLQTSSASYEQLKMRFYKKFHSLPISSFPLGMEVYGMDFHIRLVQDAIKYCFNIMVDPTMHFSELHTFYFKLLWFYDRFDLILYASDLERSKLVDPYKEYITKTNVKYGIHGRTMAKSLKPSEFSGRDRLNAFLQQSHAKSAGLSKPIDLDRLNDFLGRSKTPSAARSLARDGKKIVREPAWHEPNRKNIHKVFANMLPVGHFLNPSSYAQTVAIPILYAPDYRNVVGAKEWEPHPEFAAIVEATQVRENDMLVGYYDKNLTSVELKFKLRQPIHLIEKHDDSRMQERGSACNTRKKEDLHDIMKLLEIETPDDNIRSMCELIKLELMRREILEHKKQPEKRVKWFYFHFENHVS
jgi:hypothetical protein